MDAIERYAIQVQAQIAAEKAREHRLSNTHTERLANRIIANHQRAPFGYGMAGAAQVFANMDDPGAMKRKHAEAILYLRRNRETVKSMGRSHYSADTFWLNKCAAYRREAVRRINAQKEAA